MRWFLRFALLLSVVFLSFCSASDEEKIHQVLNRREEALRRKDLSLYLSCISTDYQDKGEDFSGIRNRMERYFKTFDQVEYSSWDRTIERKGDAARVVQQFHLGWEKGERKKGHSGIEAFFLKKEGGQWKIISGLSG